MGLRRNTGGNSSKDKPVDIKAIQEKLLAKKKAKYSINIPMSIKRSGLIEIRREYNLLRVPPLDMEVTSLVIRLLSFRKQIFDNVSQGMRFETVDCYATIDIAGCTCIICGAGIEEELVYVLETVGYEVLVSDVIRQSQERLARSQLDKDIFVRALGQPRDWQLKAFDAMVNHRCGQLCTATGAGKTTLIASTIRALPRARILYTVRGKQALNGAFASTVRYVPDAYLVKSEKILRDVRVVFCSVGMLETVIQQRLTFDWVFVDEQHETCTEYQMNRLLPVRCYKIFALSAEYRARNDNADRWSDVAYGPLRLMRSYQENMEAGDVTPVEVRWRSCSKLPKISTGTATDTNIRAVWNNEDRNRLIINDAMRHVQQQVLITVQTVEHGLLLKQLLPHATLACGTIADERKDEFLRRELLSPYDLEITEDDLNNMRVMFARRQIMLAIATSVWWKAVDFPQLEVILRADAISSDTIINQITGRGSRISGRKSKVIVYDYLDEFNPSLKRRASKRARFYTNAGFKQTQFADSYSNQQANDGKR